MADNRVFSRLCMESDDFLSMSHEAMLLYPYLVFAADNFGFFKSAGKVIRMIGVSLEALEELVNNRILIRFDSGVYALRDWNVANGNYKPSKTEPDGLQTYRANFPIELAQVFVTEDLQYELIADSTSIYEETMQNLLATQYNTSTKQLKVMQHIYKALHGQGISMSKSMSMSKSNSLPKTKSSSLTTAPNDDDEDDDDDHHSGGSLSDKTDGTRNAPMSAREYCISQGQPRAAAIAQMYSIEARLDDDCIIFAFEQTRARVKEPTSFAPYFKTVLEDYKKSGIKTRAQAEEREEERKQAQKKRTQDKPKIDWGV